VAVSASKILILQRIHVGSYLQRLLGDLNTTLFAWLLNRLSNGDGTILMLSIQFGNITFIFNQRQQCLALLGTIFAVTLVSISNSHAFHEALDHDHASERKENHKMTELTEVTIPASLLEQQVTLTTTITTINSELETLATKRHEAETSLARINRAVAYLRGEIIPIERPAGGTGPRRPMSPEARENIRQGLLASAARKKAAAAGTVAPAPQIDSQESAPAPAPDPLPESPKATTGRKGAQK
jgi:hypothetical protein